MKPSWMLLLLGTVACSGDGHTRCQRVCDREQECAEQARVNNDRSECVEMCGRLERSAPREVDRHVGCVDEAVSCELVLECR